MSKEPAATESKENLFNEIKSHILAQAQSGERIDSETELARKFNVTRYRIRKYLDVLSETGVLKRTPKNGMEMQPLSPKSLREQFQMRLDLANFPLKDFVEARSAIESSLLDLVSMRVTPAQVAKLEETLDNIEANAANPAVADSYDKEFHLLLLQACGNPILQIFSGVLISFFDKTAESAKKMNSDFFKETAEQQRNILKAIRNGETEKAAELMKQHLRERASFFSIE